MNEKKQEKLQGKLVTIVFSSAAGKGFLLHHYVSLLVKMHTCGYHSSSSDPMTIAWKEPKGFF